VRKELRIFAAAVLDPLLKLIRTASRLGAWLGGILFFAAALLITVEIFVRKIFSFSTGAADELSGYGLAAASALALGFGLLERTHIRVDTFYLKFPAVLRAFFDVVAAVLLLWFFAVIFYYGSVVVWESWRINAHSRTGLYVPLIIPQLAWWFGLGLTLITAVLLLMRALIHLLLGEMEASRALIGTRGLDEEIADELAILDQQRIPEGGKT
jgi:TRAP-type C4-dicarboxylate transport system permease small subunit